MTRLPLIAVLAGLLLAGCATGPGDVPECPTCDNLTELLVGYKCVPIEEVPACGPDGHAHGQECHCFSGQSPTRIGEQDYCLQLDCHEPDDHAEHALTSSAPEAEPNDGPGA